jgi:hypothetical protein
MKTQLVTLSLLAFALQGCAVSNERSDTNALADSPIHQLESPDEIWGIGRRAVQLNSSPASAVQVTVGGSRADNLAAAFWFCDYVATTRGVEATPIAMCSAAYDELKTVRFGGDFAALLDWWQQNKIVEHRKVASEREGIQ